MGNRRGRLADHSASEWDALAYDRLSQPQIAWGKRVLERLELAGNETVVDAGCGSGRLTQLLLDRLPSGRVLAIDRSRAMLTQAESQLRNYRDRVQFVCADLTTLKLAETVDAVFSTATFHWIRDHDALFGALARTLKPAGKLEAQCGGGPNLARLRARVAKATVSLGLGQYFHKWEEPWLFATPQETDTRLTRAGFTEIWTTLEPAPVTFESPSTFGDFIRNIVIWPHLTQLPLASREALLAEVVTQTTQEEQAYVLDYWRLNITARLSR
jgi:trans-aconitate 2-methyltransferase